MKEYKVECFMDATDFFYELGEAAGGNRIFGSLEEVLKHEPCAEECGVVKVLVTFVEQVRPENFDRGNSKTSAEWKEYLTSEEHKAHLEVRKKYYEDMFKIYEKHIAKIDFTKP